MREVLTRALVSEALTETSRKLIIYNNHLTDNTYLFTA